MMGLLCAEQNVGLFEQQNHVHKLWDSCAQNKTSEISQHAPSGIMGLLRAEQNVGNLKTCTFRNSRTLVAEQNVGNLNKCTFRNSGAPVRRTKRRKSKQMHFQEFLDSCAQNKASKTSKDGLSGVLGFLCAEQSVGNLRECTFRNSGTPVR